MRLRAPRRDHEEVLRKAAQNGIERARRQPDAESAEAVGVLEEALGVLRRSRAILDGVADGVFVTDTAGEIRLWNRSAERLTGSRESKALGRDCSEILGLAVDGEPLDCSGGCALLRMAGDAREVEVEAQRSCGGGRIQNLLVGAHAVEGSAGEIAEIVHSIRDITTLKLADEAKTMFLATASHELKTPLTVIMGFAQILLEDAVPEDDRLTALEAIAKRADELSRIVDRLLLTGRIESGKVTLTLGSLDLAPLINERVHAISTTRERRIIVDIADDLPAIVGDTDALATVLDHLLDNAVKYSPSGGDVTVAVRAGKSDVEIEVGDQGIGMNADETRHCFDRFWQAESSDVRRYGGTGVGLYIVRSLVEGMGSSIDVKSAPGQGTTFTIRSRQTSEIDVPKVSSLTAEPGVGKPTMIEEFMRQIGVPGGGGS